MDYKKPASSIFLLFVLSACSSNSLSEKQVPDWPLKVSEVEVVCMRDGRSAAFAKIGDKLYAVNGFSAAFYEKKYGSKPPYLNWESGLFKPDPDPQAAKLGMLALGGSLVDAIIEKCQSY